MKRSVTKRMLILGALTTATTLGLAGCGGSGFSEPAPAGSDQPSASAGSLTSSEDALTIMIGSSGPAERDAVKAAVTAWSETSGVDAEVIAATNLSQELAQGMAAGSPPDLFYLGTDQVASFAANGSLQPYGDLLENKGDFYPSLVANFTVDGDFYCAPKDFSTLALVINDHLWAKAGLTDADIPTTWEQLDAVAATLTSDGVTGLGFGAEYQRVGAFMAQAGGRLVSEDGKTAEASSPANVEALEYVKEHLAAGDFGFAAELGAGWGGEALGKGLAAMVIEGNWITGAMTADFPDVSYTVAELPAGPAGKGTMQFSNCWGMAADSPNQQAALDLVTYLTSADQQMAFSDAFGPMPSISSAADAWKSANPDLTAFLAGSDYATGMPTNVGSGDVVTDFNAQLGTLTSTDPGAMLTSTQSNLEAVVGD